MTDDRLDIQPGPRPIRRSCSLATPFDVVDGRLTGPSTFYAPTSFKFYRRPSWLPDRPAVIVLHYTAVLADTRPIVDIDRLLRNASIEYEAREALRSKLVTFGEIPDCVALTLQNANKPRKASWCLCIGSKSIDGLVPVVQYSPDLRFFGTMHAGPGKLWKWRKRYRGKTIVDLDGNTRWDGKNIMGPVAVDKDGNEVVIYTPNPPGVGIEVMNVGPLGAGRLIAHPSWRKLPRKQYGKRWFHEPSDEQRRTVVLVLRALVNAFAVESHLIGRHEDYVPTKIDPEPPFEVASIRRALTEAQ